MEKIISFGSACEIYGRWKILICISNGLVSHLEDEETGDTYLYIENPSPQ